MKNSLTKQARFFKFTLLVCVIFFYSIKNSAAVETTLQHLKSLPTGLVEHIESEYNDIFINKTNRNLLGGINKITMSFHRHGSKYTESVRDLDSEYALPVKYTQIMPVGLVYQPEPANIIMLGLGGGVTTQYMKKYLPSTLITVVELDNEVINMAKKYFGVKESKQYQLVTNDARVHLRKNRIKYDIIMIDAFRGGYIPFHLLTTEFYKLIEKRMTKKAVLVINLHGGSKLFDSSMNTLKSIFTNVDTFGSPDMGNVIIVAYDHEIKNSALVSNAEKIQKEKKFYYDMRKLLKTKRYIGVSTKASIFTDDFAPVNIYNSIKTYNLPRWD